MPFIKTINLPNNGKIGLWENTETSDQLKLEFLSHKTLLEKLKSIELPKRQEEFCITQLILRELYGDFLLISKDKNGKPFLDIDFSISISHSDQYSAVMLVDKIQECGIDVEIVDPRMAVLHSKFMNDYELLYVPQENRLDHYTVVWCLKEAIYKWYAKKGLDFKQNMIIHPFTLNDATTKVYFDFLKDNKKTTQIANYFVLDNHIVAYVAAKSFEKLVK